ncbi:MAG: amino acid permease [Selenomonadaceae bacterium]|nr:amino acid permease [Selenomonadaceae bacterium]
MEKQQMVRGLKNRHLQMIALGGAIGTGLFYGSAAALNMAGPAVMLAYLGGGLIIYLIMRMLGEMAVAEPVSASFSHYAHKYWGSFPGFMVGWNYWFNYLIVSMAELTAVGIYVHFWWPEIPQWVSALLCLTAITALNLVKVKLYGETEFWLAMVKVAAILGMIILGLYLLATSPLNFPANLANMWEHGGFFPKGLWGVALSVAVLMFSFGGIELIGITAGEAENPEKSIPRAINQVLWRILLFYVGTMAVLTALWPWNEIGKEASPFVQIFVNVGIPAAAHILNFVVLMAAVSVYNSAIYSNSRMLYGLAKSGNAPAFLARLSASGVPTVGILVSSGLTLTVVIINYFFPGEAFMYMLAVATCAAVITWISIAVTHLKFRARQKGRQNIFPSPFFPVANYLCLVFLAGVIFLMTQVEGLAISVAILPLWLAALWLGYRLRGRGRGDFPC